MTPDEVHAILSATYTYRVEIRHPGAEAWNHIHHPDWETSTSYADTWIYANAVRRDHPDSDVRIVETADGAADQHIAVP